MKKILLPIGGLFATLVCMCAAPAPTPLATVAPTPIEISLTPTGCIDLTAGPGKALTNCHPYLASRPVGTRDWKEETSAYRVISQSPGNLILEAPFENFTAKITILADASGRQEFSGELISKAAQPMELARFHYLDGQVSDPAMNLLSMRQFELPGRIIKPSETLPTPLAACKRGWGGVHWPRLADPIHAQENVAISGDTGMLASDWNTPGFFLGFTGPGAAFGELGIRTARPQTSFFSAVLLDAVRIDPAKSRVLERSTLAYGDPQDELRHWAVACRDALGPARISPPLVGYCSWYQTSQDVQPAEIRRALASFSAFNAPPGGQTIQIDDGFQVCPGDWSGRGEWKTELNQLPAEIAAKGFIPGIWIAPTAIHATHPIVKEHPDWLQRGADGSPCIRFHNWKQFNGATSAETYFLEPDHPEARKWILNTLRKLRADGWKYFKFDFAYTVSSDRVKFDPYKTTHESLRDQWKLFREGVGEDAQINSCIGGILRYSIGSVDVSRLGGDIGGDIKLLRRNLAEMMLRSHVNGLWFQADPDVYYMRSEKSKLNFEQSHLLTATQGLLGTAFLTSDFGDQWSPQAVDVVRRYWNQTGPRVPIAQHIVLKQDGLPAALAVAYGNGEYAVGTYNWDLQAADVSISLKDLRLPENQEFQAEATQGQPEKILLANGVLTLAQQPAESLRIVRLRTANRNEPLHENP